ncbi:MAG: aspartate aminotransferase family protein [Alphaproteobacteria bacterium]|nr:aspartate aminotransferase family protein [Alphaproteobacteria bacterium]
MQFPDFESRSAQLYERAKKVLPGGNTRTSVYWPPYQVYAVSGNGSKVTDADGIERVDLQNNFTALIHGHAQPLVSERIIEQVRRGTAFGLTTEAEIELAELLCARVPSIEQIRFANSGTEATMNAIKLARAYTGRPKYAKCEGAYHGSSEFVEVSIATGPHNWGELDDPARISDSYGTPQGVLDNVVLIPFNNVEIAERILERHAKELAGVMIDPMPVRIGMVQATPDFLQMIQRFCRRSGALLISDEVLNFRLSYRGAQGDFGYDPDVTALGKIIGGGLPVGAIGGRAEIMRMFDPSAGHKVWHGGTFNGNPATMVAGHATMELMTEEAYAGINRLGEFARTRLREAFATSGVKGQVAGRGSLFRILMTDRPMQDYRSYYPSKEESLRTEWLMRWSVNHGFLLTKVGIAALSTVNTQSEIEQFSQIVHDGLLAMRQEGLTE